MKKLKLRKWVKVTIVIISIILISLLFVKVATDRVNELNNKETQTNGSIKVIK